MANEIERDVSLVLTPSGPSVSRSNFDSILIVSELNQFTERVKTYNSLKGLAGDGFSSEDETYKAAAAIFSQTPSPAKIKVGRIDVSDANIAASLTEIQDADNDWYVLVTTDRTSDSISAYSNWISTKKKIYIVSTDEEDSKSGAVGSIVEILNTGAVGRTAILYSSDAADYPEAAWASVCLTVGPGLINWKFRTLVGIEPDVLTGTESEGILKKKANYYIRTAGVNRTSEGTLSNGEFIDQRHFIDSLQADLEEKIFSLLISEVKLPYTQSGANIVAANMRAVLQTRVDAGSLSSNFEIVVPKVSLATAADRAARTFRGIRFSARTTGTINIVRITGSIN